ncbi:uncharacterized protein BDCG_07442 [Blastomyces dermatitidis ER-3]|uniref:Uncharacterized protein n=2 Tax=Ajellomyces dermatitidis TaxID=5039 RepID=F2TTI3_AJEDA|nr:uncharacterized protein BDCG_07442 [Blastomyces dermatitidis ER-3]EEQ92322.2 hypothetical protein BDCG_07442 [Blastomyces dermatitidis ER-3]EGE86546.2 hypothetical protein BDDG_09491 [Blastomyces dermatitidis ATCC 18188]EQL30309.1 hypothetical protein BDFG_07189 [Blastomyces dermatitidis ATCC 26199]
MRDQLLRAPPSNPRLGPAKMASNKHPSGQQAKPFTPTMSSTFRATKNPLTPKLAGYTPTRTTRNIVYTESTQQQRNGISRPATSTPTSSSLLSANVTPRSGLRLSRRDGNASPAETSPASQHALFPAINDVHQPASPHNHTPKRDNPAISIPRLARARSVANEMQLPTPTSRPTSSCGSSGALSMFFHADDTRSPPSTSDLDHRPGSLHNQPAPTTFLYADGTTTGSSHREPPRAATPSDKAARVASLRQPDLSAPSRSKQPYISTTLPRDSQILRHDRTPASPNPTLLPGLDARRDQQSPTQPEYTCVFNSATRRPSHTKSSSMDTSEYGRHRKHDLLGTVHGSSHLPSTSQLPSPSSISRDKRARVVSGSSSESIDAPTYPSMSGNHSPAREDPPRNADIDKINELASNARRERKVLDLEISNSSLLAINRILERELRKQSAELRRYRRLTRSGRFSMTESTLSAPGRTLSIVGSTDDEPSDISLTEDSDQDPSTSSDNGSTRSHDETATLNEPTGNDAKHRIRDEKRFILDFGKHQQLLINSQKMNQSIKRCLGWTESLIQEGKKALDYHVRVSDIDIGGRVLAPDELEGEAEGRRGLLSPTSGVAELYRPPNPSPSDIRLPDSD